jgi:hypothetical protein
MAKILSIEEYRRKHKPPLNPPSLEPRIQFKPLSWENPAEIEALIAGLEQRFSPRDCVERCMLENLIHSTWRLRRLEKMRANALIARPGRNLKALEQSVALAKRSCTSGLRMLQQYRSRKTRKHAFRP